jgi:hypothetical protein
MIACLILTLHVHQSRAGSRVEVKGLIMSLLWFFSLYVWIVDHLEHVAERPKAVAEYPELIVEYLEAPIEYPSSWTLMKLTSRRNCSRVIS